MCAFDDKIIETNFIAIIQIDAIKNEMNFDDESHGFFTLDST